MVSFRPPPARACCAGRAEQGAVFIKHVCGHPPMATGLHKKQTSDRETSDRETSDRETSDRETSDREIFDRETSDRETSGRETSDRGKRQNETGCTDGIKGRRAGIRDGK